MLAKIFPCHPAKPGFAQLMIRLRGDDALLSNLHFTLCNNEQNYLQPDGRWSQEPHLFTISEGYAFKNGSGFRIGPDILDPLLASSSQVQIQAQLSSNETRSTTLQLVRDELFSSDARGETADYGGSSVLAAASEPEPAPAPAAPSPAAEIVPDHSLPAPKRAAEKSRSSLIPIIVAVLLALLMVAAAIGWFLLRSNTPPASAENGPETPIATAPPEASGCSPSNLAKQSELDFVQNCVQQQLSSEQLLTVIQQAKETKHCGVAQRLYAHRAQAGDTKIALAYAAEYDPLDHTASDCFKAPDPDTAIYWYETVLQTEPQNEKAKQRLEALKK